MKGVHLKTRVNNSNLMGMPKMKPYIICLFDFANLQTFIYAARRDLREETDCQICFQCLVILLMADGGNVIREGQTVTATGV